MLVLRLIGHESDKENDIVKNLKLCLVSIRHWLDHMLSIVLVLGIRKDKELLENIQHRHTKMTMHMQDKAYEERLQCLRLWILEQSKNRQNLNEVFKMYRGLVMFCCMKFLCWMKPVRVQVGTRANWLRPGA